MPATDPIISDDDAKELFRLNTEVRRLRNVWDLQKEIAAQAKEVHSEATEKLSDFLRGLNESYPLFDHDSDDEPLRIAQ